MASDESPPIHTRRPRYAGRNPRRFHEKYKELNPDRYPAAVRKVVDAGKTPAGMHRAIMVREVVEVLAPTPGAIAIDCTLGFGEHARALLERIQPGGRLIGLDVDPIELPRTHARLRAAGFADDTFRAYRRNFAGLLQVLAAEAISGADLVLADLGVSSMQLDNPARGFTYKESGPLDMRMNPGRGEPASRFLRHQTEDALARLLEANADEPAARVLARALTTVPIRTTGDLRRRVESALRAARPDIAAVDVEKAVRRTFQALRIAVNDEFSALETFLRHLPACLAAGGRVAILTFHSGEDRRVKKAFAAGQRDRTYAAIADQVVRPSREEVRANPRAASAKLRWAIKNEE
ncbi:MAG: 16S rRNA (cytosine(1402)-N(4))-methyltransferase RsmH [Vicinamibacterales bacterium]